MKLINKTIKKVQIRIRKVIFKKMTNLQNIISELKSFGSPERAKHSLRFFKTGQGQYGEGDIFYGASVPEMRIVSRKYKDINLDDVQELLKNEYHECRLVALLILVDRYEHAKNDVERKKICNMYLKNTKYINNWDLVDLSSHEIVGEYLLDKPKSILLNLAKSKNLWEKRIAVISTFTFIREGEFNTSLKIAKILIEDKHDLIQKAVGWMLREIGKRDLRQEETFLKTHYKKMGRTALRYAIEKFPEGLRQKYLLGKI